jgi:hypothetical protein
MPERMWYYVKGKKQAGPVSQTELQRLISIGEVKRDTLVWSEPMTAWVAAGKTGEFHFPPSGYSVRRPLSVSMNANILHLLDPILEALAQGKVIRTIIAAFLQVIGVCSVLGGIYLFIEIMKISFSEYMPTVGTIGGIILGLILLAAVGAVFQIMFYRARSIHSLPDSSFTVIPILSMMFRAVGEAYAAVLVCIGVGGCITIWFAGEYAGGILYEARRILPFDIERGVGFLDGVFFLILLAAVAFVSLVVFYFLAESIVAMVDIAKNTRELADRARSPEQSSPSPEAKSS